MTAPQLALFDRPTVYTTPGTRLQWSDLEEWLEAWNELQSRRWRGPRIRAEQAHVEALEDVTIRECESVEVLELVREIGKARKWRDRKPVGPGGESVLLRIRCHNQAVRVRRTVPDFAAMVLELELERELVKVAR